MKDCKMCEGKKWITLQPMNLVAPCVGCSADKKLSEIEADQNGKLCKVRGEWKMTSNNEMVIQ